MTDRRAEQIVEAILKDHNGRRGLRHEWDAIDQDIQEEIRAEWVRIVREARMPNKNYDREKPATIWDERDRLRARVEELEAERDDLKRRLHAEEIQEEIRLKHLYDEDYPRDMRKDDESNT